MIVPSTVDPIAAQMAQLVLSSDTDELREIIQRWVQSAATSFERRIYDRFGAQLLELRQEMARLPVMPTREELEVALTVMLSIARQPEARQTNHR